MMRAAVSILMAALPAAGQTAAPRTGWGAPDLQGVWNYATITPLERPVELAGKQVLTDKEAADFEKQTLERRNPARRDGGAAADVGRAYNQFWWDYGSKVVGTKRTSLIVDPPDGKIPPLTEEARQRADARTAVLRRPPAGPEDRNLWERCILGTAGPPVVPGPYNNNFQIFQTRDYVVILNEMIHDARIIPLDGRPHLPSNLRQWMGDSRGRWEGKTLVVDVTNFSPKTDFHGSRENLHLIERWTRIDANTLEYVATMEDSTTWPRPWTIKLEMARQDEPSNRIYYEPRCHEGNAGMVGMLVGSREDERAFAAGRGPNPAARCTANCGAGLSKEDRDPLR